MKGFSNGMNQKTFSRFSWGLFSLSLVLGIVSWGQTVGWQLSSLTPYQWFPLFGILAWLIMWTHYITRYFRVRNPELQKAPGYGKVTGWIVLACLLLHPGILAFAQFRNNQGIPPESYLNYVGEGLQLAVLLGSVALTIFLSFEIFDRMKNNKTVKKYWLAISISQSLAMILIFVHALRLGTTLGEGWFRIIWIIYGLLLLPCFYAIHKADLKMLKN